MNSTVVSAYMIGAIIFVICMLLAIASAQSIRYEAGINPQDKRKRKIAFWVLAILCPIAIISVTYFTVYCDIRIPPKCLHCCHGNILCYILHRLHRMWLCSQQSFLSWKARQLVLTPVPFER